MAFAIKQAGIERGFLPNLGWYVALDVETTGFSPQNGDSVIESGAVVIEKQDIIAEFSSLIDVDKREWIGECQ